MKQPGDFFFINDDDWVLFERPPCDSTITLSGKKSYCTRGNCAIVLATFKSEYCVSNALYILTNNQIGWVWDCSK